MNSIAGIYSDKLNVLGMMPHPENLIEDLVGGTDGRGLFESLVSSFARRRLIPSKDSETPMIRNDVAITPELVKEHGLKPDEYERFVKLIGREPTITELGIVSAMWNEHCSYKSSRIHLRGLPTKAPWVIQGPGENAGVIDIGDGLACIFKMESHNHPSFIEPYQGAATGVGGILRDVFTMGARPIAALNFLRFGEPDHPEDPRISSRAWWPASAATAIPSACRPSAAAWASTSATTATSWSTPWRSASPAPTRSSTPRPPASGTRSSISAPRPAATASTAPPWPRPSSTTRPRRSARPCRSATPSPRSCCWRPASSS